MAPRSKDLIEVWEDNVWTDTEIRRFTTRIHPCSVTATQNTTQDLKDMIYCKEINFVQYFIQRYKVEEQVGTCEEFRYRVRIEYYLEDTCDNQVKIQDFFECLDEVITNRLGPRWLDNVDNVIRDTTWPDIRLFGEIEGRQVYVGSFTYFAEVML